MSSKQHAAILCSPGMGHLIPVLELGKQLVTHQNFAVTIFIFPSSEAELKAATCTKICDIVQLPPPDTSKPANLIVKMRELRHVFRSAVCAMKFTPTMLIVDLFGTESFPIAEELGIPKYLFFASNAWFLSFVICCPTFDMEVEGNFVDHKEPLKIPGCRELRPRLDVIDIMLDRTDQRYHDFVGIASRIPKCSDGILLNTWKELEPITLAALRDENLLGRYSTVPVYPIGPIIRPNESNRPAEIMSSKQHAAILCSPGMGHLIPVLELGKRLVTHLNFAVTIFISPSSEAELKAATSPKILDIVQLPPPDISGLVGPDTSVPTKLVVMMRELRQVFRSAVRAMKFTPTMLIVDLFGTESFPIAQELGIPKYLFFASNAWFFSFLICCLTFDKEVEGNFVDHKEPLKVPGCREFRPQLDVFDVMLYRTNQQYHDFVGIASRIPKCSDGILLNMWEELEPTTLAALRDENLLGRHLTVPNKDHS
ncbi:hypothetical protein DVH24_026435 [Malus domestica]|uniref:Uncharacterized protein n=1 Tax=Malus domestica TaxID=3750 RepID=A0A498KGJ3_MALDO|nr:hypothetical protein DVH24_026435 [Malus domestica]